MSEDGWGGGSTELVTSPLGEALGGADGDGETGSTAEVTVSGGAGLGSMEGTSWRWARANLRPCSAAEAEHTDVSRAAPSTTMAGEEGEANLPCAPPKAR